VHPGTRLFDAVLDRDQRFGACSQRPGKFHYEQKFVSTPGCLYRLIVLSYSYKDALYFLVNGLECQLPNRVTKDADSAVAPAIDRLLMEIDRELEFHMERVENGIGKKTRLGVRAGEALASET